MLLQNPSISYPRLFLHPTSHTPLPKILANSKARPAFCEAMLTIVDNIVFCQVLRHIILDNSLDYFAHYACQTNWSVIPWLTPISLLVNRNNVSISQVLWNFTCYHRLPHNIRQYLS